MYIHVYYWLYMLPLYVQRIMIVDIVTGEFNPVEKNNYYIFPITDFQYVSYKSQSIYNWENTKSRLKFCISIFSAMASMGHGAEY